MAKIKDVSESGFFKRFSDNPFFTTVTDQIRNLSNLGMKFDDMVVKQSKAIGATEAQFASEGPMPQDLLYTLAMADIGTHKYVCFFDKDYKNRREFLRKFCMNGEIEFIIDTIADEAIVYDDKNFFCYPDTNNLALHLKDNIREEVFSKI